MLQRHWCVHLIAITTFTRCTHPGHSSRCHRAGFAPSWLLQLPVGVPLKSIPAIKTDTVAPTGSISFACFLSSTALFAPMVHGNIFHNSSLNCFNTCCSWKGNACCFPPPQNPFWWGFLQLVKSKAQALWLGTQKQVPCLPPRLTHALTLVRSLGWGWCSLFFSL